MKSLVMFCFVALGLWALIGATALFAQMPPKQYQGGGEARIAFMGQPQVNWLCKTEPKAGYLQACVIDGVIIAPNPCHVHGSYAKLICHEMAHINGFPGEKDAQED